MIYKYMQHKAFRMNKLSQKQTSTSAFEAPEKFWKAKKIKVAAKIQKQKTCFVYTLLQKFNVENLVVEQAFVATNSNLLRYITRF